MTTVLKVLKIVVKHLVKIYQLQKNQTLNLNSDCGLKLN